MSINVSEDGATHVVGLLDESINGVADELQVHGSFREVLAGHLEEPVLVVALLHRDAGVLRGFDGPANARQELELVPSSATVQRQASHRDDDGAFRRDRVLLTKIVDGPHNEGCGIGRRLERLAERCTSTEQWYARGSTALLTDEFRHLVLDETHVIELCALLVQRHVTCPGRILNLLLGCGSELALCRQHDLGAMDDATSCTSRRRGRERAA
jgi:hypothetical protein